MATVVNLLEDTMDINKTLLQRVKGAFTLEQPLHKIRRSRKTMIGFITTMLICQVFLQAIVFPYIIVGKEWLKTTICGLFVVWAVFGLIFQALGPGVVKRDASVTLMHLLEEFDVREVCPTCKVIILPRSRHCNVCKVCVDRYDHHCQWLNNCVGIRNHTSFLVFLLSLSLCFIAIVASCVETLAYPCKIDCPLHELCVGCDIDWLRYSMVGVSVAVTLFFSAPVGLLSYIQMRNFMLNKTSNERFARTART